jgi:hypothetical protein
MVKYTIKTVLKAKALHKEESKYQVWTSNVFKKLRKQQPEAG